MMLDALSKGLGSSEFQFWMQNGGEWALEYDLDELYREIIKLEKSIPLAIEIPLGGINVGVIHAEVPGHQWQSLARELTDSDFRRAIWGRSTILSALYDAAPLEVAGIDYVVLGHTPLKEPFQAANRIYIDTGAGHSNGDLTVAMLESLLQNNCPNNTPELFRPD
jgi:serine/threonine protein phosphatase 1